MNPVISNNFALTALKQGEDAFVCDLTNQMAQIAVDASNKVIIQTDISTTARIIKGAGTIPSGVTPTPAASMVIAGVTPTVNIVDGEATYTWTFAKGTVISDARTVKKITLTYDGHSYKADFTLVTDKSGATYDLLPSMTEIPFVRDNDNVLIPASTTIYCGYVKDQNGTITTINGKGNNQHTNIDGLYYIYYRIKNADGSFGSYTQMTKGGIKVNNSDTYAAIEFILSSANTVGGIADGNIRDIEDVPVVRQNERGYGIVCSVQRDNFTEAQWNTDPGYGVIGHEDTWTDTSAIRNNARKGDLFTVVGAATDTRNGHTATYRCTNASGNLAGVCIAHAISKGGLSINSADIVFVLSDSGTTAPADNVAWKTTFAELDIKNANASKFVWQATKIVLSSGTTNYTGKQCLGKVSEFASVVEQYALGSASAATGTWQDNTPPAAEKGKYLWTRTKLTYADSSVGYSPSETGQCIGYFGTDGKGISSVDILFCLGDSQTTAPDDSSFTATTFEGLNIKSTDADKFVWQCTKTTYTSGSPTYGGKVCLGKVSEFASVVEQYALGSASAATGTWQDNTPPAAEKGKYLWTRTKLTYSGGGTTYIPSESGMCLGYYGNDGDVGNGINSVTRYRMFTMTFAAPSANDSGWKSEGTYDVSGLSKTNRYLWQKKVTTYTQTSIVDNEISLIAQFDDGVQPNLLEDTAFNSDGELDAWTVRNQLSPSGTPDYTPGVKTGSNAKDGVNSYYDRTAYGSSTIQYKEVLQQDIWNYSGVRKIDYSDWYTFSFWAKGTSATLLNTYIYPYCVDPNQGLYINGIRITGEYSNSDFSVTGVLSDCCVSWKLSSSWKKFTVTFRTRSSFYNSGYSTQKVLFRLLPAGISDNYCYICMPKLERNTMATAWLEHTNDRMADDIQHVYVGNWVSGTTYYYGGGTGVRHVVRAKESASGSMTYWRMKQRTTSAGYTSTTQPYNDTNHWEKANYLKFVATDLLLAEEVITDKLTVSKIRSANDTFVVDADGNVTATSGTFNNIKSDKGTFTNVAINSGKIGGFDISNGRIGSVDATATGDGGSMSLTSTFFRVGDASGYAMLGNNVFPATLGGAFTAVGRIINKRTNSATSYGFDVANYGLYIEVSGGTKNYGIQSTAAIRGSAVYGDRVKELDLSSSSLTYNIDLSQYNVFIMKRSTSAEYGVNLPDEDSIKKQFGYNSLPADYSNRIFFGVRFTLICGIQYGAKKITINNVYNCNGNLVNIDMEQGDVLELLVTNYGGTFRYMQVNKQYD